MFFNCQFMFRFGKHIHTNYTHYTCPHSQSTSFFLSIWGLVWIRAKEFLKRIIAPHNFLHPINIVINGSCFFIAPEPLTIGKCPSCETILTTSAKLILTRETKHFFLPVVSSSESSCSSALQRQMWISLLQVVATWDIWLIPLSNGLGPTISDDEATKIGQLLYIYKSRVAFIPFPSRDAFITVLFFKCHRHLPTMPPLLQALLIHLGLSNTNTNKNKITGKNHDKHLQDKKDQTTTKPEHTA